MLKRLNQGMQTMLVGSNAAAACFCKAQKLRMVIVFLQSSFKNVTEIIYGLESLIYLLSNL